MTTRKLTPEKMADVTWKFARFNEEFADKMHRSLDDFTNPPPSIFEKIMRFFCGLRREYRLEMIRLGLRDNTSTLFDELEDAISHRYNHEQEKEPFIITVFNWDEYCNIREQLGGRINTAFGKAYITVSSIFNKGHYRVSGRRRP